MLPVILAEEIVDQLFKECAATEGYQLTIDLDAQEVRTPRAKLSHLKSIHFVSIVC